MRHLQSRTQSRVAVHSPISGHFTGPVALTEVLDRATIAMWPRRTQQELLFDLGERKRWSAQDRREAICECANWLNRELALPAVLKPVTGDPNSMRSADEDAIRYVRTLAEALPPTQAKTADVASWIVRAAPGLGAGAKALANSLGPRLQSQRADHRWIRGLHRASIAPTTGAWCFHRRDPASVAAALGAMIDTDAYDVGDATLLVSLLALWQRRRSTAGVRANRGQERARRDTPKPIAGLAGVLASPGQAARLRELLAGMPTAAQRGTLVLLLETFLTEAHLVAHRARVSSVPDTTDSSHHVWMRNIEQLIAIAADVLPESDTRLYGYRVALMRAYQEDAAQPAASEALHAEPYVAAYMALVAGNGPNTNTQGRFAAATPGIFMHMPALRRRGLLEDK